MGQKVNRPRWVGPNNWGLCTGLLCVSVSVRRYVLCELITMFLTTCLAQCLVLCCSPSVHISQSVSPFIHSFICYMHSFIHPSIRSYSLTHSFRPSVRPSVRRYVLCELITVVCLWLSVQVLLMLTLRRLWKNLRRDILYVVTCCRSLLKHNRESFSSDCSFIMGVASVLPIAEPGRSLL